MGENDAPKGLHNDRCESGSVIAEAGDVGTGIMGESLKDCGTVRRRRDVLNTWVNICASCAAQG